MLFSEVVVLICSSANAVEESPLSDMSLPEFIIFWMVGSSHSM